MKFLSFITHAPVFGDEDKSRAAAILHFILVAITIANIAAILARPFLLAGQTLGPVSANIFILVVQVGLFALMHKGYVRVAGFILTAFIWLILSFQAYASAGILNPVFGVQTVVIVMAGLLINEWAALGFALLSSLFGLWLVQIAEAGKLVKAVGSITTQQTWMNDTTAFAITGLLLFLSLRTIREARKRAAQQTLSRLHTEERYRSLVESAPDSIYTLDHHHRLTFMNRSALGPVENFIGKIVYDFLPPDSHEAYRAAVNRVFEVGSTEHIEVNLAVNGQTAWYAVRFAPIREAGKVVEVTAISTNVTEQKAAQIALRASEARYHHALDNLMEGAQIIGFDWRYLYVNDIVVGQGRQPKEVLLRSKMTELYPGIENTEMFAVLRTSMEQRIPQQIQNEFAYPDGSKAWFELRVQPVPEGIFVLSLDITERKLAESSLRESEARLSGIIESAMDAIITLGEDQRILHFNAAAETMFHISASEIIGQPVARLIPEKFRPLHGHHIQSFGETGVTSRNMGALGAISGLRANGEEFPIEAAISQVVLETGKYYTVILRDITERKKAEEALRRSEEEYRELFSANPHPMLVANIDTLEFLAVNDAAVTHYGYSRDEFLTMNVLQLRADDPELVMSQVAEVRRQGVQPHHAIVQHRKKDGSIIWVELAHHRINYQDQEAVLTAAHDLTERLKAEAEVVRSEELFSTIFQSVPVAITIIALKDKRIINVNDYLLKLTGYTHTEVIGLPIMDAPYWMRPDQWDELPHPLHEGELVGAVETEWHTRSGQPLIMLRTAVQVRIHNEPCLLALALDITERRQAERIKLQVYKERELVEVKERFISRMSHEFRTPLSVILTANELLRRYYDRMNTARREEHFQNIENQVRHVTGMLDDVLTLSKERAGKMPFTPARMNLASVCARLFEQIQATDNKNHAFVFITDDTPFEIDGDEKLLQHILVNLISNAIKYSPDGGEVRLEVRCDGDEAVIRISDQGIGIPEDDQKRLFEPFYRASNTQTIQGTGLGLAIAKESVETHRGTIGCESTVGQGTTFVIRLPVTASLESDSQLIASS